MDRRQAHWIHLNVNRLTDDDLRWADYVMISAMIVHKASVPDIVDRCRRFSKPVIAGGPLFTTGHAAFPDIDHFVLGEAEELMPQVLDDMRRGTVRHMYTASSRPDIRVAQAASPAPPGRRTDHHRPPLSPCSGVAVNRGRLTRKGRTLMRRALGWVWKTRMLSTFLAGLFAVLPIVITVGIMAWVGGLLKERPSCSER